MSTDGVPATRVECFRTQRRGMPFAAQVPDQLKDHVFRGSEAIEAGLLTRTQLESRAWNRLFRDVYRWRELPLSSAVRIEAARLAGNGQVLAGRAAAFAQGNWTPPPGTLVPMEVARQKGDTGTPLRGVARSRRVWRIDDKDVFEIDGVAMTSPLRTAFDLTRTRHLVEAVVVIDAFANALAFTVEEFAEYAATHVRWPGVRTAKLAATYADARAQSPGETRTRMVALLGGFPRPELQVLIVVPEGERFLDRLLVNVPRPVGVEFDGIQHREHERHRGDLRRENSIYVETRMALLRYDSYAVHFERPLMLRQMSQASRFTDTRPLSDRDFALGPRALRW